MFSPVVFILALLTFLSGAPTLVSAAWPQAQWVRPTMGEDGVDRRASMRKFQREWAELTPKNPHPPTDFERAMQGKSRSYHLRHGPIFPEHHEHLTQSQMFWPEDHQLFFP